MTPSLRWLSATMLLLTSSACSHSPAPTPPKSGLQPQTEAPKAATSPALAGRWWRDDVFYEIFVRSFADSDGDGVGDFNGLTARLDTLNDGDPNTHGDLGINGIWLMPIHPSPSYHGYDVTDYRAVNPAYGTMADFDRFLAEAHKRGIKVIIDFVLNHSAKDHPWFKDARTSKTAKHRDWYTFRDAPDPRWKRPWDGGQVWHKTPADEYYYGLFWSGMPDVNLSNPEAAEAMVSAMEFWLDKGVDGFRVDAVRHLFESEAGTLVDQPQSHAFMKAARQRLLTKYPEAVLVAEAWTDSQTVAEYFGDDGDEFQLAFSFDAGGAMVTAAKDGLKVTMAQFTKTANEAYPDRGFEAPFLTNHDMPRVMRQLKGDAAAARVSAATLLAQPGTPFIYYGEEIGMQGGASSKDEDKRTPMRWTAEAGYGFTTGKPWHEADEADEADGVDLKSQRKDPNSLWRLYRDLIRLRQESAALSHGQAHSVPITGGGRGTFALLRQHGAERVLFVANYHREAAASLSLKLTGTPEVQLQEGLGKVASEGGVLTIEGIGPQGFALIQLR